MQKNTILLLLTIFVLCPILIWFFVIMMFLGAIVDSGIVTINEQPTMKHITHETSVINRPKQQKLYTNFDDKTIITTNDIEHGVSLENTNERNFGKFADDKMKKINLYVGKIVYWNYNSKLITGRLYHTGCYNCDGYDRITFIQTDDKGREIKGKSYVIFIDNITKLAESPNNPLNDLSLMIFTDK